MVNSYCKQYMSLLVTLSQSCTLGDSRLLSVPLCLSWLLSVLYISLGYSLSLSITLSLSPSLSVTLCHYLSFCHSLSLPDTSCHFMPLTATIPAISCHSPSHPSLSVTPHDLIPIPPNYSPSLLITSCHSLSLPVTPCLSLSLSATLCQSMSLPATPRHPCHSP